MIRSLTRAGVWVLFVLAAANGIFLYFLPSLADTEYAWSIKPPVNAAFIGAGFLAGTLATGLVLRFATRWRAFALLPIALWVLAASLLAATIIHEDRFKWDYPPTWVWAFVYAGVPLAVPFLMAHQRRYSERPGAPDPALLALRVVSGIVGAGLLIGAVALFADPGLGEHWPWALTPLLARAVAAWYALFGTLLLTHAIAQRRRSEGLIGYATLACWSVLLLLLPVLHAGDVSGAGLYVAGMVGLLALGLWGVATAWPERSEI